MSRNISPGKSPQSLKRHATQGDDASEDTLSGSTRKRWPSPTAKDKTGKTLMDKNKITEPRIGAADLLKQTENAPTSTLKAALAAGNKDALEQIDEEVVRVNENAARRRAQAGTLKQGNTPFADS